MIGNTFIAQNNYLLNGDHRQNDELAQAKAALGLFNQARLNGRVAGIVAKLFGRSNRLQTLDETTAEKPTLNRRYVGLHTVAVDQIRGTQGRSKDFDARFNPRREHNRHRWTNVAQARLQDIPLPPVELIQVGDTYFVRDGHHRVSVARALGEAAIEAQVTVWEG